MTNDLRPVLDILNRLIAFPTVSDQSNAELVGFIAAYLDQLGVHAQIVPNASGEKLGLIAQIGPSVEGGVLLSGHTDVVTVEGQAWTSDPWVLTHREGKFYGRGTCDMKGFLALALAAVPQMLAAPLTRPVQLAFSYDEEIGCLGTQPILAALDAHQPRASAVIVGEPSLMTLVTGHKGGLGLKTRIMGKAAHSSRPDIGVSAIEAAARLIQWHQKETVQSQSQTTDNGFTPPYSTAGVGTIHGGIALNTIPENCVLESDIRFVPPDTAEDWIARYRREVKIVEATMIERHAGASITVDVPENIPALRPDPNGVAAQLVRRITEDNDDQMVSYQTEAGHFQAAGYSTVICGPGSIEQAHGQDEFISAAQLRHGQAFMKSLIQTLC
ncbi:acetylornithine deacetylase [Ruegeria halocynthiae]|uniref:Acetylornithine deacetylase n=1 Tax=Ruegeria halocynthiae TaxID=985054 RepID=A0A1H3EHQ8_9RHOB|nr:acetylornithine deacetylase [Ruegeria halocynthiae]SDX78282.1 acetylornithine deacetylase [Ruegeria halocynthiae]